MNTTPTDESNWSEAKLQSEMFQWHYKTYKDERGLLFTVDNNANDKVKGAIRKAMGRIAGVSDMLYLYKGTLYCFEVKLPGESQSKAQLEWGRLVTEQGADYNTVSYLSDFKKMMVEIHEYGYTLPF